MCRRSSAAYGVCEAWCLPRRRWVWAVHDEAGRAVRRMTGGSTRRITARERSPHTLLRVELVMKALLIFSAQLLLRALSLSPSLTLSLSHSLPLFLSSSLPLSLSPSLPLSDSPPPSRPLAPWLMCVFMPHALLLPPTPFAFARACRWAPKRSGAPTFGPGDLVQCARSEWG
jgi:hypothetical protein